MFGFISSGQTGVTPIQVGPGFSSKFLANDIEYLHCLALDKDIHGDSWLEIAIRGTATALILQCFFCVHPMQCF